MRFTKSGFHNCGIQRICKKLFTHSTGFSTGFEGSFPLSKFVGSIKCMGFPNIFNRFISFFRFNIKCLCRISIHFSFCAKKCGRFFSSALFSQGFAQYRFGSIGIQTHICHASSQIFIVSLRTDHSTIVTAKLQRR